MKKTGKKRKTWKKTRTGKKKSGKDEQAVGTPVLFLFL
jgi:hypothetical protein